MAVIEVSINFAFDMKTLKVENHLYEESIPIAYLGHRFRVLL